MASLNSVISDPEPYTAPTPPPVKEPPATGWQKLAESGHYEDIYKYLEGRKDFYRRYLPGGEPIEKLTETERMAAWGQAMCVIKEIEGVQATIALYKK